MLVLLLVMGAYFFQILFLSQFINFRVFYGWCCYGSDLHIMNVGWFDASLAIWNEIEFSVKKHQYWRLFNEFFCCWIDNFWWLSFTLIFFCFNFNSFTTFPTPLMNDSFQKLPCNKSISKKFLSIPIIQTTSVTADTFHRKKFFLFLNICVGRKFTWMTIWSLNSVIFSPRSPSDTCKLWVTCNGFSPAANFVQYFDGKYPTRPKHFPFHQSGSDVSITVT